MPYDGSGTRTGSALEYVLNELLREDNGDRPEADNIVITITDGNSQVKIEGKAEQEFPVSNKFHFCTAF